MASGLECANKRKDVGRGFSRRGPVVVDDLRLDKLENCLLNLLLY
jgi:hypothetical protein